MDYNDECDLLPLVEEEWNFDNWQIQREQSQTQMQPTTVVNNNNNNDVVSKKISFFMQEDMKFSQEMATILGNFATAFTYTINKNKSQVYDLFNFIKSNPGNVTQEDISEYKKAILKLSNELKKAKAENSKENKKTKTENESMKKILDGYILTKNKLSEDNTLLKTENEELNQKLKKAKVEAENGRKFIEVLTKQLKKTE